MMNSSNNAGNDLIILVYSSLINPELTRSATSLNDTTDAILAAANKNNQDKKMTGALYYGHQHFFQCIEGPANTVVALFNNISNDSRHEQIKLLAQHGIDQRMFSTWSMKFVHSQEQIPAFFKQLGYEFFEPEKLNEQELHQLLLLLQKI